jgi:hypothetical protein
MRGGDAQTAKESETKKTKRGRTPTLNTDEIKAKKQKKTRPGEPDHTLAMSTVPSRTQRTQKPKVFPDGEPWKGTKNMEEGAGTPRSQPAESALMEMMQLLLARNEAIGKRQEENIQKAAQDYQELREEIKALREENKALREENKALREENKAEIEAIRGEIKALAPGHRSWASVAAGTPETTTRRSVPMNPNARTPTRATSPPGITMNIEAIRDPEINPRDQKAIRERIRDALESHENTKDTKWIGVSVGGAESKTIRIHFREEEDAARARENKEWVDTHFKGARLEDGKWHPVKIDRVNKAYICDESLSKLKSDICETIGRENQITVTRARMLGRSNPDKRYCSIVIHVREKEEAKALLHNRYLELGSEVAFTSEFEERPWVKRCFKCQKFGHHEAKNCPEKLPTCRRCAELGHTGEECVKEDRRTHPQPESTNEII